MLVDIFYAEVASSFITCWFLDVYIYKSCVVRAAKPIERCQQHRTWTYRTEMKSKKKKTQLKLWKVRDKRNCRNSVSLPWTYRRFHRNRVWKCQSTWPFADSYIVVHLVVVFCFCCCCCLWSPFDVHRMQLMSCKKLQIFSQVFSSVN